MFLHCKNIVEFDVPVQRKNSGKTVAFTVTVSEQAAGMIDQLITVGLHGATRAEVARSLMYRRLEELFEGGTVQGVKPKRDV